MLLFSHVAPQQVVLKTKTYHKMLWNELSVMIPQKGWIGKGESPKFGLNLEILSFCIAAQKSSPPSLARTRKGEKVAEWCS